MKTKCKKYLQMPLSKVRMGKEGEDLIKHENVAADLQVRGSCVPDRVGRAGLVAGQDPPGERPRPGL